MGATDDSRPPPRVRLRVFEAHFGICWLSDRKIMPGDKWDLEHKLALALGGENRESNLAPALVEAHKAKTAQDVAILAKDRRVRSKHLGIEKRKAMIPGSKQSKWKRTIDGRTVRREE